VFAQLGKGRINTHPVQKDEHIPKQDGQGMAHEKVVKASGLDDFKYWAFVIIGKEPMCDPGAWSCGYDGDCGNSSNAAGAEGHDPETLIKYFGETGARQNRFVLLVVINYEQPQQKQSGQDTARHPAGEVEVSRSCPPRRPPGATRSRLRSPNSSPTNPLRKVWLQYDLLSGSHAWHNAFEFMKYACFCPRGKAGKMPGHLDTASGARTFLSAAISTGNDARLFSVPDLGSGGCCGQECPRFRSGRTGPGETKKHSGPLDRCACTSKGVYFRV